MSPTPSEWRRDGNEGGGGVKAKATKRAMATVPRVVSNNKGYGNGKKGCRQVTAMRATVAVRTVVGKDEGGGDDNVGSRQGRV